jgi:hypothetical protein
MTYMCKDTYSRALPAEESAICSYLSDDVYACEVTGGAVLLDLRSLQYSALEAAHLPALRRTIKNWQPNKDLSCPDEQDPSSTADLLEVLETKGFLRTQASPRAYFSNTPRPTTSCAPNWNLRAGVWISTLMLIQVLWIYPRTIAVLRSKELRPLLQRLYSARARTDMLKPISPEAMQRLLTLFAKLRVWLYTARGACLLDSLVLASVLLRHDVDARLHIGVTLTPFSAHAWVQVGDCVLDDTVANVAEYTPILVV